MEECDLTPIVSIRQAVAVKSPQESANSAVPQRRAQLRVIYTQRPTARAWLLKRRHFELRFSISNTLCVFVRRPARGIADHALRAPTTFGAIVLDVDDVDQLADTLEPETL
jgi:hypothetical protein